jgi:hypothetical protein
MIYIHLKYRDKRYTIRCLWDAVLNEGTASKEVIKKREWKAKKKLEQKETKITVRYSELSKDVMIWEGTVYKPRGIRRILKKKKQAKTKPKKRRNTLPLDSPPLLFRGTLEDAKKLPVVKKAFSILKKIFAGLYITTNIVETIFNVKSKFSPHRTMKFGERMLVSILYSSLVLKEKNKEELHQFFKEKVITYDFIMQNALYGSGIQKNKPEEQSFLPLFKEAFHTGKRILIHYCDRNHNIHQES